MYIRRREAGLAVFLKRRGSREGKEDFPMPPIAQKPF